MQAHPPAEPRSSARASPRRQCGCQWPWLAALASVRLAVMESAVSSSCRVLPGLKGACSEPLFASERRRRGAQYGLFNVTSYPVYNNCSDYAAAVVKAYPRTRVTSVDNVTVVARGGPDSVQLPVTRVGSQPPQQGARARLPAAAWRGQLGKGQGQGRHLPGPA